MRTSVFLGLLFIADAINSQSIDNLSSGGKSFIGFLIAVMLVMDFVELGNKRNK